MTDVPRDPEGMDDEADAMLDDLDEDENKDQRYTKRRWDKYVEKDGELSESEDEDENERNGVRHQSRGPRRRNIMDYQNPDAVPDDDEVMHGNGVEAKAPSEDNNEDGGPLEDEASNDTATMLGDARHSTPAPTNGASRSQDVPMLDADADSIEVAPQPASVNAQSTTSRPQGRPQEATPPDSPVATAAFPAIPAEVVQDLGNEPMDEGDTLDDPEVAKEKGVDERERENAIGEKAKEVVERSEAP